MNTLRQALVAAIRALNSTKNFSTSDGRKSYDLIPELEKVLHDVPPEGQMFHVYRVEGTSIQDLLFTVKDFHAAMSFIGAQHGEWQYDGDTIGKFSSAVSGVYVGLNRGPVE